VEAADLPDPGDDLAGVDADPQLQAQPVGPLELAVDLAQGRLHRQGGVDGPSRIVLVGDRAPEEGHHRVADKLVDSPAALSDLLDQTAKAGRGDVADLLGVELLGDPGKADDVGEEHGDRPPLLDAEDRRHRRHYGRPIRKRRRDLRPRRLGRLRRVDRAAALIAEAAVGRVTRRAGEAENREGRSALVAEPARGRILRVARVTDHRPPSDQILPNGGPEGGAFRTRSGLVLASGRSLGESLASRRRAKDQKVEELLHG